MENRKTERPSHTRGAEQKEKCGILVDDKLSSFQNGRYRAQQTCGGNVSSPPSGTRIPASRVINQRGKRPTDYLSINGRQFVAPKWESNWFLAAFLIGSHFFPAGPFHSSGRNNCLSSPSHSFKGGGVGGGYYLRIPLVPGMCQASTSHSSTKRWKRMSVR